jgi:hypothetical protein
MARRDEDLGVSPSEQLVVEAFRRLQLRPNEWTALARALGIDRQHADRRVKRWGRGQSDPEYQPTVRLLAACGFLTAEGRAFLLSGSAEDPADLLARERERAAKLAAARVEGKGRARPRRGAA